MILIIDNYDTFLWAIPHQIDLDVDVQVKRNDAIDLSDLNEIDPDGIIVSAGPGRPCDAGISNTIYRHVSCPVLGICLGHQALCTATGGAITRCETIAHGKKSEIAHDGRGLFRSLPERIRVGRYHSLAIDRSTLPSDLVVSAEPVQGDTVMAVRHRTKPFAGVQFHPESILTRYGDEIIANFISSVKKGEDPTRVSMASSVTE